MGEKAHGGPRRVSGDGGEDRAVVGLHHVGGPDLLQLRTMRSSISCWIAVEGVAALSISDWLSIAA
jgi:hypothetical protein